MKRAFWPGLAGLSCLLVAVAVMSARAMVIAPPAVPLRVAASDRIVVGTVTGFGDKMVPADMHKGDTRRMQIAHVRVDETFLGKAVKEVKVGFFPPRGTPPPGGPIHHVPTVQLTVGQEACIFLVKHPTQKGLYVAENFYDVINKKGNPNFLKEMTQIRKSVRQLADPMTGLKSKDAEERFTTAALLVTKYRTPKPGAKTEPVGAEESKLILLALVDADWNAPRPGAFGMNPQQIFARLGLTAKDGWVPPRGDLRTLQAEATRWLRANAGKYRLERFVPAAAENDPEPGK